MMKKINYLFLFFASISLAYAQPPLLLKNKDGSSIQLKIFNSNKLEIKVQSKDAKKNIATLYLNQPAKEAGPFSEVKLIDFDEDGFYDVESTGLCGNHSCSRVLFRYNPKKKRFIHFYEGSYSTIKKSSNQLIFSAGSGCCAREHKIFDIPDYSREIRQPALIILESISNDGKKSCEFQDRNGKSLIPSESQKKFCEFLQPETN